MSAPAIGVRRRFMPRLGAVDWSHPLAAGLFAMRTPWGLEGRAFNAATQLAARSSTGGFGVGGFASSTSDSADGFQAGPWTYVVYWTPGVATTQALICQAETPSSAVTDRIVYTTTTGGYGGYIFDGAAKRIESTSGPVVGRADLVALVCNGSALDLWVNGAREVTTAVSNFGFAGYASPEVLWGRCAVTGLTNFTENTQLNSTMHFGGVWRRALSHNEIEAFVSDPLQMFRF